MSNQSPSANSRDQRGRDVLDPEQAPIHDERPAPNQDESGFTAGVDESEGNPPSPDIDKTEDPSKD